MSSLKPCATRPGRCLMEILNHYRSMMKAMLKYHRITSVGCAEPAAQTERVITCSSDLVGFACLACWT